MYILALIIALLASFLLTPYVKKLAFRIGAVDRPDKRKVHTHIMPRLGGLAIYLATVLAVVLCVPLTKDILGILLGGTWIVILGILDDKYSLPAKGKLLGQIVGACILCLFDIRIEWLNNPFGGYFYLEYLSIPFTIFWVISFINVVNLIDGLDGLAAGVTAIASLAIAYVAYIHGNQFGFLIVCAAMMAVAGGCIGFLPYNFYPARIFMGDSGSLFLGFMIAVLSVVGPLKRSTMVAVVIPVLVLGIPIFDTFFAIFRRVINRRPIMQADKGHLHHHLIASGYGQRRAVLMLYGISAIMGMAAVLISRDLYKDSFVLIGIACIYLYVFLTDTNHKMPQIKAVNIEKEEKEEQKARKNGKI